MGGGRRHKEPQTEDETRTLRMPQTGRDIPRISHPYPCHEHGGPDGVGCRRTDRGKDKAQKAGIQIQLDERLHIRKGTYRGNVQHGQTWKTTRQAGRFG